MNTKLSSIVTSRQDKIIRYSTENHWEEYQKYNEKSTNRSIKKMISWSENEVDYGDCQNGFELGAKTLEF